MAYGRIQNLSYDFQELYTNKRMTRFCFAVIIVSFLVILQIILAFSMHSVGWMGNSLASVIVNKNGLRHWNYAQIGDLNFGGVGTRSANLQSVDELLNDKDVRILSFCHQDWHGIRQASYGQKFPVIEVKDFYNDKQLNNLLLLFSNMPHLEIILVNGIPFGAIKFAKKVKQKFPDIQVLFIYHGSLAQMFHDAEADVVNEMITATQDGIIDRVGIVKEGLVNTFAAFGIETFEIYNFPSPPYDFRRIQNGKQSEDVGKSSVSGFDGRKQWHVGVFGSHWIHKNVLVQIVALCQFDYVIIHVLKKPSISYLQHCRAYIVEHGDSIPHYKFVELIRRMDVTMYVSLTEGFPMTVLESISVGVPALTSATSAIYSLDPYLHDALVVNEADSPDFIALKVQKVFENYSTITQKICILVPKIHTRAQQLMDSFIGNKPLSKLAAIGEKETRSRCLSSATSKC
ncbi:hypothetical protein MP228_007619 [Amoeboaphelidium protococcarum]|nr:hypothetical protein MP228_007619 [Amoeboaphelidium protococcarum]